MAHECLDDGGQKTPCAAIVGHSFRHAAAHIDEYRCGERSFLGKKGVDRLRCVIFKYREIFSAQAARVLATGIGDGQVYHHEIGVELKRLISLLRRVLILFLLLILAKSIGKRGSGKDDCQKTRDAADD